MAASPASSVERQSGATDHQLNSGTKTAPTTATRPSTNATDREILGLTTNIRRKDSTGSQGRTAADVASQGQGQVSDSKVFSSSVRLAGQTEDKVGDDTSADDPTPSRPLTTAYPAAEAAHLQTVCEANPELQAAWHDAKSYRETFATPEAACAASGLLADLNRMDALFFLHRPEDHAQLAHAVADPDPVAFAPLAHAMSQVAQSMGVTFPAIAKRFVSNTVRGAKPQEQILALILDARGKLLPAVAKRVLNEWTTTIFSANQQRRERQHTAEGRVDIGGAGGAGIEGRHSMGPREINYARMSDAEILNL